MPWLETDAMNERGRLIGDWLSEKYSKAELARRYGVSRKTVHGLLSRFAAEGWQAVEERSRAPHRHGRAVSAAIEQRVVELRGERKWGPKKLRQWLLEHEGGTAWPAASTIGEILERHGLVVHRRRRTAVPAWWGDLSAIEDVNTVWGIDFKGWFRTGEGRRCEPLTLSDLHSRYLLRLVALPRASGAAAWAILEGAFRQYGLPQRLRSDGGQPFAGPGLHGLSRFAVNVIKAGVTPERIAPGKPQQNGRHERMHRTLKEETATPPAPTWRSQQQRFAAFVRTFNEERPHEALGQVPPARCYRPSSRPYGGLREPHYERREGTTVLRVYPKGGIRWRGHEVYLSEALSGEAICLEPTERDGVMRLRFGHVPLTLLTAAGKFQPLSGARPRQRLTTAQKV